jgi:large subunit ribosomal protein L9
MKIILLEDVEKLGKTGDMKTVKSGYARNYLIPRGLATIADEKNVRELERRKEIEGRKEARVEKKLGELGTKMETTVIEISAKAGEEGRLYGTVTAQQIAEAIGEKFRVELDKRRVLLEDPIKNLGDHTVRVRFSGTREILMQVRIVPEAE